MHITPQTRDKDIHSKNMSRKPRAFTWEGQKYTKTGLTLGPFVAQTRRRKQESFQGQGKMSSQIELAMLALVVFEIIRILPRLKPNDEINLVDETVNWPAYHQTSPVNLCRVPMCDTEGACNLVPEVW